MIPSISLPRSAIGKQYLLTIRHMKSRKRALRIAHKESITTGPQKSQRPHVYPDATGMKRASMKRRRECALAGIPVPWKEGLRGGPTRNKRRARYVATCPRCGRITNAVTMVDAGGREYFMGRTKFMVCRCLCGHTWRESQSGRKGFSHTPSAHELAVPAAPEAQRLPWYRRWWAAIRSLIASNKRTKP